MTAQLIPRNVFVAALLLLLALLPVYCATTGNYFLMSLFTRILILAMAAVSLNLIMGFGGMVSFGHAAYLGIGGYAFGILAKEGISSGFVQWPVALIASGLFALGVGALSLVQHGRSPRGRASRRVPLIGIHSASKAFAATLRVQCTNATLQRAVRPHCRRFTHLMLHY